MTARASLRKLQAKLDLRHKRRFRGAMAITVKEHPKSEPISSYKKESR